MTTGSLATPTLQGAQIAPWRVLVMLRWALLRRALSARSRGWQWTGLLVGTTLAGATVAAGLLSAPAAPLVPIALGGWALGCAVAPVLVGRRDQLRPELFVSTGLSRPRLLVPLLAGSLVSVPGIVLVLASLALVATAAAWGGGWTITAGVVGAVSTLALLVGVARLAATATTVLLRTRLGAVAGGTATGLAMAVTAQGWALVPVTTSAGLRDALGTVGTALPSGWAVRAVALAHAGDAIGAALWLIGQFAMAAALLALWGVLLSRPTGGAMLIRPRRLLRASSAGTAARAAEHRAWSRDLVATQRWTFALVYAFGFCALPLGAGWTAALAWSGPAFAVMAVTISCTGYATTGSSLWLVLAADGARADSAARVHGLLVRVGIVTAVLTTATAAWAGGALPGVVATAVGAVGVSAGVSVLVTVWLPISTTDPHRRGSDPLDTGSGAQTLGPACVALLLALLVLAPVVTAGLLFGWWGVPVGAAVAVIAADGSQRLAARQLEHHGDRVLAALRGTGAPVDLTALGDLAVPWATRFRAIPRRRRTAASVCFGIGAIALVPQGILPLVFLAAGVDTKVWFLALHLPDPWNRVVAVAMTTAGAALLAGGATILLRALLTSRRS